MCIFCWSKQQAKYYRAVVGCEKIWRQFAQTKIVMNNRQRTSSKDMSCLCHGSRWQMWHAARQGPGSSSLDPSQSCWPVCIWKQMHLIHQGRGGEWLGLQLLTCMATELGTWSSRLTFPGIWRSENQNHWGHRESERSPSSTSTTVFATKPSLWFACLTRLQMRI